MIALAVTATWIGISVVGAKGLMMFAGAAASSELDVDSYPVSAESGLGEKSTHLSKARAKVVGATTNAAGAQP